MPMGEVSKSFTFEAGHHLPGHPLCGEEHGHSYKVQVFAYGELRPPWGMVIDFTVISELVKRRIISKLDHKNLNDLFPMPSAELITRWILQELREECLEIQRVRVYETEGSYAEIHYHDLMKPNGKDDYDDIASAYTDTGREGENPALRL